MTDHEWLEEVEGERALDWVRAQNVRSIEVLEAYPSHSGFQEAAAEALTAPDRIPYGSVRDGNVYNFWQDDEHVKGIWRRTPVEDYLADRAEWEVLLDIDALAADEDQNWVFAGAVACRVDGRPTGRYLLSLSIGGRDATTVREYDLNEGAFVDDGFVSPEAKQGLSWLDADTVLIATDWGDGTVTESGYPSSVRRWRRGDALSKAEELHRGEVTDVGVWPMVLRRAEGSRLAGVARRATFFTGSYLLFPDGGEPVPVPLPEKADIVGTFDDLLLVTLQESAAVDGTAFRSGDVVALDLGRLLVGERLEPELVFRPGDRQAVKHVAVSEGRLLLAYSDTVVSRLAWLDRPSIARDAKPNLDGEGWEPDPVELPGQGEASIVFADADEATVLVAYQDFLTPDSLLQLDGRAVPATPGEGLRLVRSAPLRFETGDLTVDQRFATSTDGIGVPYFLVHRSDLVADASTPTLLYGYGGFEIPMTPAYSPTVGRLWLEQGGAYAVANIRGGGEFGPAWHQAGLKQQRQIVYDDFIAVAEDLIATGVTSSNRLGIMGGSNGGLLVGVMLTQRPELFRAVVVQVPLLDMLRYHLLLAGASWVDEYGSPDVPDERAFLETISPYHRFDPNADYPTPFFVTSTKDDRVHPGHARKMAKRFEEAGKPFLYFENIDGGHGAATTQLERARRVALEFTYLTERLTSPDA